MRAGKKTQELLLIQGAYASEYQTFYVVMTETLEMSVRIKRKGENGDFCFRSHGSVVIWCAL